MTTQRYDVAVLGAGPGGYPAAIRLAQAGKRVALIEANAIGGTCLNRGCIPTKALIANAEVLHAVKHASDYGIITSTPTVDFGQMSTRKDEVVAKLKRSLEGLITSNGIELIHGYGAFVGPRELKVGDTRVQADHIIIATGSEPKEVAAFPFDGKVIHSSTTILAERTLPKRLIIVGGGVIGCEFASMYNELGVSVVVVEALPRLLPFECENVSTHLTQSFRKRGIEVHVDAMVDSATKANGGVTIKLKNGSSFEADAALIAIGRQLNSAAIGLEQAGVKVERGAIVVDESMRTTAPGIFAIGDVTGKSLLAHVATHQGLVAADTILGHAARMNYDAVPGVIFTRPEIGTVGMCHDVALKRGYKAKRTSYPFQALGKAQAALQTDGFAQVVVEENTGRILGAQVMGHEAGILVAEMAMAIANELTIECVSETIHAHPTLSEVWTEGSLLAQGLPLHFPPLRKA